MTQIFIRPPESVIAEGDRIHRKAHQVCREWKDKHHGTKLTVDRLIQELSSDPTISAFFQSEDGYWLVQWVKTAEGQKWTREVCDRDKQENGDVFEPEP